MPRRIPARRNKLNRTLQNLRSKTRNLETLELRSMLDATLVFNEIHYHPQTNEPVMEWIELYNQMGVNMDVSGWKLAGGADFVFPANTVVPSKGYLVIALSPTDLQNATGYTGALGPFTGRLSNAGEELRLENVAGRIMDSITYASDGAWPAAPDGSGVTLSKLNPDTASDVPANWSFSKQIGGSPGAVNFPVGNQFTAPSGLVSYYDFDQLTGQAIDLADGNHGTLGAGSAHVAGNIGPGAVSFNNTSSAGVDLGLGSNNNFAVTSGVTVEALVQPTWNQTGSDVIFAKGPETGTANLISYWSFDEASSGTTPAIDTIGNNNGTFQTGASHTTGLDGSVGAASFNNASQAGINVGPGVANNFSATTGITLSALIRPTWSGNLFDHDEIFRKEDGTNRINFGFVRDSGNGAATVVPDITPPAANGDPVLAFGLNVGGTYTEMRMPLNRDLSTVTGGVAGAGTIHLNPPAGAPGPNDVVLKDGNTHHVAASYDSATGEKSIWIDGVKRFTVTLSGVITSGGAAPAIIGNQSVAGGRPFSGTIDDMAVWDKALTPAQIQSIANGSGDPLSVSQGTAASAKRILLALQNDGNNGQANPPVAAGPVLSFGLNVGGIYSELDMPLDGQNGRPTVAQLQNGAYHHIVATYDAATGKKAIVIDGVERFSTTLAGNINNANNSNAMIGNNDLGGSQAFTGKIDEVAFWNRAITQPEINNHYTTFQTGQDYFNRPDNTTPQALAINEISSATDANFQLELVNYGTTPINVGGFVVRASTGTGVDYVLPAQTLLPGQHLAINQATLGADPILADKLFLYTPGKASVLDAIDVRERLRGRDVPGTGKWLFPNVPTFGAANSFNFHDEIVINEIMYHHSPESPIQQESESSVLIPSNSPWSYNQTGTDLLTDWREPFYNDNAWPIGPALFMAGSVPIPANNARAGALRYFPVTGDADSEISATKSYTHKVDFGPSAPALINGVQFDNGAIGSLPANITTNMTLTNAGNANHNATGGMAQMLTDMIHGVQAATVTLTGLTPGQTYDTRIYVRQWITGAARGALVSFNTDGVVGAENAIFIDEDNAALTVPQMDTANRAYVLSYTFKAESTQLVVSLSANSGNTFHLYGLTNEVTSRLPIGTLYSTGLSTTRTPVVAGQPDPHYQLIQSAHGNPVPSQATTITNHSAWFANNAGAQWISVVNPGTTNIAAGDYVFRTTFDLTGFDPTSADLTMSLLADNFVTDVIVNGVSTGISATGFTNSVGVGRTLVLSDGFISGINTLDFVMNNADGPGANPGGFWANVSGSALPLVTQTPLNIGPNTYYFRKEFTFDGNPANTTLTLHPFLDDGAVYYLNGVEIYRKNMPEGEISYGTNAAPAVGTPTSYPGIVVPADALIDGVNVFAVEVHQADPHGGDVAFDAELRATEILVQGQPFAEDDEEWIELYNKSNTTVDLSGWRLDEAVDFTIPNGTMLAPGQYLVIVGDAVQMALRYPSLSVLGEFDGGLPNSGGRIVLRDSLGNPADEVRYFDSANWHDVPDGGGSSLELRDPDADNTKPEAWAPSIEDNKSDWETITYRGIAQAGVGPVQWNEFVLGMLAAGEVLLDDISVKDITAGNVEKLQNTDFEAQGLDKWRVIGNHKGSVIVDPENPSNHVFRLIATGPTDHMHNHAETTFIGNSPIVNGREYEITYKAKWVGGSNQVNSRLYFNRLAETNYITRPELNGTPGAQNSQFVANIGPTYSGLKHGPVTPEAGQQVLVNVRAEDPNGVSSMKVYYSVNGGAFAFAPMTLENGVYSGSIPGQGANAIVQFYVEGTDGLGAISTFPAAGPNSRALYKVQDGQAQLGALQNLRIVMTSADQTTMFTPTNVMSNDRMGGTVIINENEVYYDVGIHLRSSQRGRLDVNRVGYNIQFNPDQLYRGTHPVLLIDRSGGYALGGKQDEMILNHVLNLAGIPGEYFDLARLVAPNPAHNGSTILLPRYEDEFLEEQFSGNDEGTLFGYELIYYPTSNSIAGNVESLKLPQPDLVIGYDFSNLGDDKETYRWMHLIKNNRDADDYSDIIALNKALSLSGTALDTATQQLMDVDEWIRTFAMMSLGGVNDAYTQGNNHNLVVYTDEDGVAHALPWDWDFAFSRASNSALIGDQNLAKVFNLTGNRRLFMGHMQDIIASGYNTTYLTSWANYYAGLIGQNWAPELTYIGQRVTFVQSQFPAQVAFNVITTFPNPVNTPTVTISGDAWINVKEIRIQGRDEPLELTWTDLDSWTAVVPLETGTNNLVFEAIGFKGNVIATDSVTVTTTFVIPSQLNDLRITEVMYHPLEIVGIGNNDLEFIELKNIGQSNLSLLGVELSGAASFEFTEDVILAPGEYVLLVGDDSSDHMVFRNHYGPGLNIAGALDGNLSNSSEQILLTDSLGQFIHDFTYFDTWHPTTDGDGPSLVIIDDEGPTSAWDGAAGWQPSAENGGSPGEDEPAATSTVAGRHLFYNQSRHDGNSTAANAADDGAIATDKTALMPGQTASFANVSSYTRGINGLIVDIAGLPGALTTGDFDFKVGNNNTPSGWAALATAPTVSIRTGAGTGGSDRVTLIWPSGSIIKQWLQVTVKANANTGLATPDVFYFGNAIAESGNGPDLRVTVSDEVAARNNPYSAAANGNVPAPVTNKWDYNRDGNVSVTDQTQARANQTTVAARLQLITVPSLLQGQGLVAQSLGDSSTTDKTAAPSALVIVNTTSTSSSAKAAAGEGSVATSSTRSAGRLSAQALEAALSDLGTDNLPTSAKRASVDSDLLELIAGAR